MTDRDHRVSQVSFAFVTRSDGDRHEDDPQPGQSNVALFVVGFCHSVLFAAGEEESFFASCLVHNILNVQVTNPMTGRHIDLEIKADATSCLNCCALQTHP